MNMKKLLPLLLAVLAIFALAGCDGRDGNTSGSAESNGVISDTSRDHTSRETSKEDSSREEASKEESKDLGDHVSDLISDVESGVGDTSVQFLSNETLFVLGNNVCQIIKGDEVKEEIDVSINTPSRLYISDNNTAILVLSKYSSTTQKIIKVYNKSGVELFTQEIDGLVKSVSTDGKYIAVLTDDNVQIFNHKGNAVGSADVNTDAEEVIVSSRNTYVYSLDKIERYSSVGDNTEDNE